MYEPVYLGNDYEVEYTLTEIAPTTGKRGPLSGSTVLEAWLSATDAGAEVHASLRVTLTERSLKLGTYYGVFAGTDLTTRLTALLTGGQDFVFLVMADAGNVKTSNRVPLRDARRAV